MRVGVDAALKFIDEPLSGLGAWTNYFLQAEFPVLVQTHMAIEDLRANEDEVDANMLGEIIAQDPFMTLKVMAYAANHRHPSRMTDPETVTACLVMMGISPFFRTFGPQMTTVEFLAGEEAGLKGLHDVLTRAQRASSFALAFAVHRTDPDAAVVHQAALLHDMAEMLMWCHAPKLALRMRDAQLADPTLRSSQVQKMVFNVDLLDLQQNLMRAWRLPPLLIRMNDDRHAETTQERNVHLAVQLARHTALRGWRDPAVPDDVREVSNLLQLSVEATMSLLHSIDDT